MATYTPPTIANYNDNPPTNDGSTNFVDNGVDWNRHINEIGDPLETYIDAVNAETDTTFDTLSDDQEYSIPASLGDGVQDATATIQAAFVQGGDIYLPAGEYLISDTLTANKQVRFHGVGRRSVILVPASLSATTDIFELNPDLSEEKRTWAFKDFYINTVSGTPGRDAFRIDITTTNKFLSNLDISGVHCDELGGQFQTLINPTNLSGYFQSYIHDNWTENGYLLHEIGDSIFYDRNTVHGDGIGTAFDIDQLADASHITIHGTNCTASGGLCHIRRGRGIIIDQNQCELDYTFDGSNSAIISVDSDYTAPVMATKIINNNVNTKGNTTRAIFVGNTTQTYIDGNTLFVDQATDVHIYIDTDSYNTVIGPNNLYQSTTGAIIDPIITNNGVGTIGIRVPYSLSLSGWDQINSTNDMPLVLIKDEAGIVTMFGYVDGPSAGVGATLLTIDTGYRPNRNVHLISHDSSGVSFLLNLDAFGALTITDGGCTELHLDGLQWNSLKVII